MAFAIRMIPDIRRFDPESLVAAEIERLWEKPDARTARAQTQLMNIQFSKSNQTTMTWRRGWSMMRPSVAYRS